MYIYIYICLYIYIYIYTVFTDQTQCGPFLCRWAVPVRIYPVVRRWAVAVGRQAGVSGPCGATWPPDRESLSMWGARTWRTGTDVYRF